MVGMTEGSSINGVNVRFFGVVIPYHEVASLGLDTESTLIGLYLFPAKFAGIMREMCGKYKLTRHSERALSNNA